MPAPDPSSPRRATEWAAALATQLLARHGVVTREAVAVENMPGGFGAVYEVLKAMEEAGRIRRGYFVGGLGATQFALPAAVDLLRSVREEPDTPEAVYLAATDPANPYGAILKWPACGTEAGVEPGPGPAGRGPTRSVGAGVILVDGRLAAYVGRADRQFLTYLPEDEPSRSATARAVAAILFGLATGGSERDGMIIAELDGVEVGRHPLAPFLLEAGFVRRAGGFQAAPERQAVN